MRSHRAHTAMTGAPGDLAPPSPGWSAGGSRWRLSHTPYPPSSGSSSSGWLPEDQGRGEKEEDRRLGVTPPVSAVLSSPGAAQRLPSSVQESRKLDIWVWAHRHQAPRVPLVTRKARGVLRGEGLAADKGLGVLSRESGTGRTPPRAGWGRTSSGCLSLQTSAFGGAGGDGASAEWSPDRPDCGMLGGSGVFTRPPTRTHEVGNPPPTPTQKGIQERNPGDRGLSRFRIPGSVRCHYWGGRRILPPAL